MLEQLIKHQHDHFGIAYYGPSRHLSAEEESFRLAAMLEELSEFILAESLEDKLDALIDLMVFTMGTIERMGLPITQPLMAVIRSNLQKELGPNKKRGSFHIDLIKPEGWEPVDMGRFVNESDHN